MSARNWACNIGFACVVAVGVSACATLDAPKLGASRDQVQSTWGVPSASYALADGQRVFYRRKPGELQRLDFDNGGRLVAMEQALTADNFRQVVQGRWDAAELQRHFGPPARRLSAGDKPEDSGSVWVYSWLDFGTWRLARVRLDGAGVVRGLDLVQDPQAGDHYR